MHVGNTRPLKSHSASDSDASAPSGRKKEENQRGEGKIKAIWLPYNVLNFSLDSSSGCLSTAISLWPTLFRTWCLTHKDEIWDSGVIQVSRGAGWGRRLTSRWQHRSVSSECDCVIILLITWQLQGLTPLIALPVLIPSFSYCLPSLRSQPQGDSAARRGPGWSTCHHWPLSPHSLSAVCSLSPQGWWKPMGTLGAVLGWSTGCQAGNI